MTAFFYILIIGLQFIVPVLKHLNWGVNSLILSSQRVSYALIFQHQNSELELLQGKLNVPLI